MSRLYIRIYLTVIGSLLLFAMLAGLTATALRLFDEPPWSPWPEAGAEIVERLLPARRDRRELAAELAFWHERTGMSLLLRSPDGEVIARAGPVPPDIEQRIGSHREDGRIWRGWRGVYGLNMEDGRQLIAVRPERERHWTRPFGLLAGLVGIALAVAVAAFPLIRYLARRLERLERGVAAFGAGDLSARVDVAGRDEIAKLAATFNASADRIEALLNAHKTLLANASHELRSPLSRLRMAIEGLPSEGAEETRRAEIKRNIGELDALVEEILLASRLQADTAQELTAETVDLVGLVAEECAAFDADFTVTDGGTPVLDGDPRLLRRLFRNLLENAQRYGGGGPAEVALSSGGGMARITVRDHGPGVAEAERERIFQPFYRPRNVAESAGSTGLGLALVRQIAERHGGAVRYVAPPDGGACFEVTLPLGDISAARAL
jgi:signal transduction histidine kinase